MTQCPMHPDGQLVEDPRAGDVICGECGLVIQDRMVDVGTEWRSYASERSENDPSRVGAPERSHFNGADLTTAITASSFGTDNDRRLANMQNRLIQAGERQMLAITRIIDEMADRDNLSNRVKEEAALVFKEVQELRALRGKNLHAQAAACLYIACRQVECPRTFKEICAISSGASKKQIGHSFKKIAAVLKTRIELMPAEKLVERFCSRLRLLPVTRMLAERVAIRATNVGIVAGRSPVTVAAAAIKLATDMMLHPPSVHTISEMTGAADTAIRQVYNLIEPQAQELMKEDVGADNDQVSLA